MKASQVRANCYRVLHALELLRSAIASEKESDRTTASLDAIDEAESKVREVLSLMQPS